MAAPLYRRKVVIYYINEFRPCSLCDFGCGNGSFLKIIKDRYPDISLYGVDLSISQIEENKRKYNMINWYSADIADKNFTLPWRLQFEYAISTEVIEHIQKSNVYLFNIQKYLKDGGHLFLTTQSGKINPTEKYVGHFRHWSSCEMERTIKQIGFSEVLSWNEGFPFHDLSKYIANLYKEKTIEYFGVQEYGLFQKAICKILEFLFLFNSKNFGSQLFLLAKK